LQGERIEHPAYMREKGLLPDYSFYITNQIMKPVSQIYSLVVESLEGYSRPKGYIEEETRKILAKELDPKKAADRISVLRETCAEEVLFEPVLRRLVCKSGGNKEICEFFERSPWN
jgi:hypothetical protein